MGQHVGRPIGWSLTLRMYSWCMYNLSHDPDGSVCERSSGVCVESYQSDSVPSVAIVLRMRSPGVDLFGRDRFESVMFSKNVTQPHPYVKEPLTRKHESQAEDGISATYSYQWIEQNPSRSDQSTCM